MLTGSLEAFPLTDVVRFVAARKTSARIEVRRSEGWGVVFLRHGLFTGVAVEGHAAPNEDAMIDSMVRLLQDDGGEFNVVRGDVEHPGEGIEVEDLLERVEKRLLEWKLASEALGGLTAPLELVPELADASVNLTAEEWRLIARVDGRRSAREVCHELGAETWPNVGGLWRLSLAGLVRVVGAASPERRAQLEQPAQPAPVEEPVPQQVVTADVFNGSV